MTRFFLLLFAAVGAILILFVSAIFCVARADVFITVEKSVQRMYVETPTDYYEWDVRQVEMVTIHPLAIFSHIF